MPAEAFPVRARESLELVLCRQPVLHFGWEEYRPKKFHADKMAASLVYHMLPLSQHSEAQLYLLSGVSEMFDLSRQFSVNGLAGYTLATLDEALFYRIISTSRDLTGVVFVGSPAAREFSPQVMRYCASLRVFHPNWMTPIQDYIGQKMPRLDEAKAYPILVEERPGRFFELQTRNRSVKFLRKNVAEKKAKAADLAIDASRGPGWAAGAFTILGADTKSEAGVPIRLENEILDGDALWTNLNAGEGFAFTVAEFLHRHRLEWRDIASFTFTGFPSEVAGYLARGLCEAGDLSTSQFRFPEQMWGTHFAAQFLRFLYQKGHNLLVHLVNETEIRLMLQAERPQ